MIKNYIYVTLEKISTILFSLITLIVFSRLLEPEDIGAFSVCLVLLNASYMLIDSGISSSLFIKENQNERNYSAVFTLNIIFGLVISIFVCFFCVIYYLVKGANILITLLLLSIPAILIKSMSIISYVKITIENQYRFLFGTSLLSNIISISSVYLMIELGYSSVALMFGQIFLMSSAWVMYFIKCPRFPEISLAKDSMKSSLQFGIPITVSGLINTIFLQSPLLIFSYFSSLEKTGIFSQSFKISNLVNSLIKNMLDRVTYPRFCSVLNDIGKLNHLYGNTIFFVFTLTTLSSFFIFHFSENIVNILLGEKWIESVTYLKILVFALPAIAVENVIRSKVKALGKTADILKLEIYKRLLFVIVLIGAACISMELMVISFVILSYISTITIALSSRRFGTFDIGVKQTKLILLFAFFLVLAIAVYIRYDLLV